MSERYGTHKNRNFTGKIFVIALAVLLLGTVAYMISQFRTTTSAQVTAVESGGEVVNNHRMQMRVDVTREDPNAASYCIVQALDYDKAEVGRREFVVPAGGDKVKRMTVDVNTRAAAHAGKVYGCSATIPEHLKVPQQ